MRFERHYTQEEARALLPQIREWLKQLARLRRDLEKCDQKLSRLLEPGRDLGGDSVNRWVKILADVKALLIEFYRREIQIKDLDRGLLDFPSLRKGKEVFLCWEKCEDDIEFWHDLDAGYAGRERIED